MNAHRQDMVNVELTVQELRAIVEEAIVRKYPFLAEGNGWELQDTAFHEKNLHNVSQDSGGRSGATYFFVKDVGVDIAPLNRECKCANRMDAPVTNCQNNCLKPYR